MISVHKLRKVGGIASFICAGTYIIGFLILILVLAPFGYGSDNIDALAVVEFISEKPYFLIMWNSIIYILNAIAFTLLVLCVSELLQTKSPYLALISKAFGLIWATLVLGAGMIANLAVEHAYQQFSIDPIASAESWKLMHMIELGLGGGNEIAGGVWFLIVGLSLKVTNLLSSWVNYLAIIIGVSGLTTVIPLFGEFTGALFGSGAILWFFVAGTLFMKK